MTFGLVVGTVVATQRSDGVDGARFLLVQGCTHRGERRKDFVVALDGVGAGVGEMVMVTQGPSARQTRRTDRKPVDALVSGIVDLVDEGGAVVYRK
jgi:microcompartment protein CcmK/EutM